MSSRSFGQALHTALLLCAFLILIGLESHCQVQEPRITRGEFAHTVLFESQIWQVIPEGTVCLARRIECCELGFLNEKLQLPNRGIRWSETSI